MAGKTTRKPNTDDEGLREDGKRCCASITTSGLRVYMKQSVSFAGIALSLL